MSELEYTSLNSWESLHQWLLIEDVLLLPKFLEDVVKLRWMVITLVVYVPFFSIAASGNYSLIEEQCRKNNPGINNSVVMGCADSASEAAKKSINESYKQIVRLIKSRYDNDPNTGSSEIARFEQAQKSWLSYRENWCDSQGFLIGSPMYSIFRMDENIGRAITLSNYYKQLKQ